MDQTRGTGPPAVWPSCSILARRLRPRAARFGTGLSLGGTGASRHFIYDSRRGAVHPHAATGYSHLYRGDTRHATSGWLLGTSGWRSATSG